MRIIENITPLDNYKLLVQFVGAEKKVFDMNTYLSLPVFEPLKNIENFNQVSNKKYFIAWDNYDIDLSSDTLWCDGITI